MGTQFHVFQHVVESFAVDANYLTCPVFPPITRVLQANVTTLFCAALEKPNLYLQVRTYACYHGFCLSACRSLSLWRPV
jgi:hypothetical protein